MKKALFKTMMCAGVAGMLLSGCTNDDLYDPNAIVKKYEQNWEKTFGEIDPNQTWNTAVKVTATANIPYITGESIMRVYTSNPLENGCKLLAKTKINGGTGNISFDAPNTMKQAFVSIENDGTYRVFGYYNVENGTVNITPTSRVTIGNAQTRAANNATKGSTTKLSFTYQTERIGYTYNWVSKTDAEWEKEYRDQGISVRYNNPGPYTTESIATPTTDEGGNWTGVTFDFSNPVLKSEGVTEYYGTKNIELTSLNNVEKAAANPWEISWGYKLFGEGGFFHEQKKYYESPKKDLYQAGDLEKLEAGFSITTSGGEIQIPFIYGATQNTNQFGYVYYKDGQNPLAQPHYILMNDAKPTSNIYFDSWRGTSLTGDMQLSNFNQSAGTIWGKNATDKVYGTQYKLTFFGENHNETGTYNFPAGYHVIFFIYPNESNYNYSLPELNEKINHLNWNGTSTKGAVKCAAWTFKGHTFVGFEDGGADEDLNDIVFWAEGAYSPDETPVVVPDPEPEPTPDAQSWIIACEDLGDTDDFDFNDVVFSVSHASGETTATVTPLAAGGTLSANIYYGSQNLGEIHSLLGNSEIKIMNTNNRGTAGSPITINVPENFTMTESMGGFSIKVSGKWQDKQIDGTVSIAAPGKGEAPQMICVDNSDNWAWPTERTRIDEAYSGFGEWGSNYATSTDWYKTVTGNVVK